MKRMNPSTQELFKRGDVRQDGYVFFAYTNRRKGDGLFVEIWLKPESSKKATLRDRDRKRKKRNGHRVENPRPNN